MKSQIIILASIFLSYSAYASEPLCPPPPPKPKEADNLRMAEKDFTKQHYMSSLLYFQNYLPKKLKAEKETNEFVRSSEFWVGYRNSLKYIEGYTLKQEALLNGGKAKILFCEFILSAEYVD